MKIDEKIKETIIEVLRDENQTKNEKQFITLVENFINGNITDDDISSMIETLNTNKKGKTE